MCMVRNWLYFVYYHQAVVYFTQIHHGYFTGLMRFFVIIYFHPVRISPHINDFIIYYLHGIPSKLCNRDGIILSRDRCLGHFLRRCSSCNCCVNRLLIAFFLYWQRQHNSQCNSYFPRVGRWAGMTANKTASTQRCVRTLHVQRSAQARKWWSPRMRHGPSRWRKVNKGQVRGHQKVDTTCYWLNHLLHDRPAQLFLFIQLYG